LHGYTQKEQGIKQRDSHLTQLDIAFHTLADNPNKGGNCDAIRKGYYNLGSKNISFFTGPLIQMILKLSVYYMTAWILKNNLARIDLK